MTAPPALVPPEPGVPAEATPAPSLDIFAWLGEQEPTWAAWSVSVALGFFCVVFGLRGVYAYWRGEPSGKDKGIPALPSALGLVVFGAWVLWVLGVSRLPV